jgi:peroxiredoxin
VDPKHHPKPSLILKLAAVYNLIWGAFIILFPNALFDFAELPRPSYPGIWQCVGMIVGVYGIGYYIAAFDPNRHWPIVLVGFLGKVFGPIGFLDAYVNGVFNLKFGLTIITNDLIWWVPFGYLLYQALKANATLEDSEMPPTLDSLKLNSGNNLLDESKHQKLLLTLVRHEGCTFCRETLTNLSRSLKDIQSTGVKVVIVHMGSESDSKLMVDKYGLEGVTIQSDPERKFYQALQIKRGNFRQLFGPSVWTRGFYAGVLKGHGVGALKGDGFQLGGTFLIDHGKVTCLHASSTAADVEDWIEIAKKLG